MQLANRSTIAVLLLFLFPLIISLSYGFQYRFFDDGLDDYFRGWSLLWFLALTGITILVLLKDRFRAEAVPVWLGLALCSLSLALTSYFFLSKVLPTSIWIGFAVVPAGLAIWLSRSNVNVAIRFLGLAGLVANLILISQVPHTAGANMLEIIEVGSAEFLAGNHPYRIYEDVAHTSFGYLPGLWLAYTPFVWLGLDVRILNVIALLLLVLLFERGFGLKSDRRGVILGATLYPLLLSPPVSQMLVHGHIWPYWVYVLATVFFLARQRCWTAAFFLGLALATRQPALWLVPPLAGWLVSRLGILKTLKYAGLTISVYLLLVLPFAIPSGIDFWQVLYLNISGFRTMQPHIHAAVWLEPWGVSYLLRPLQILVLLGAMIWLFLRKSEIATFVLVLGLAYMWAVFFNDYAVRYVYVPGLLIMIAGVVMRFSRADSPQE